MKNETCRRMWARLPRHLFHLAVIVASCWQGTVALGKYCRIMQATPEGLPHPELKCSTLFILTSGERGSFS